MEADSISMAVAAAHWSGQELSGAQRDQLLSYYELLAGEAIVAGGLGPNAGNWRRTSAAA